MALQSIPEVSLRSVNAKNMPVLGLGTGSYPCLTSEEVLKAVLEAIELGYRMFDTASIYQTEEALGEAISQACSLGLIKSRDEVFITSKLWCTDNHGDHVLPALRKTLKNMKLEYLDQYLIHWPVRMKKGENSFQPMPEDIVPMDIKSVWAAMEKCQTLGLAKSIGVSNFSCKKLADILSFAKIPPAINRVSSTLQSKQCQLVEMNPTWKQGKLKQFCQANGIMIAACSPLGAAGAIWGTKAVLWSDIIIKIAKSKGKSVAQVALRWAYEQGVVIVTRSINKEEIKQNSEIFDWELSDEESKKIAEIPQSRANLAEMFVSESGPIKSVEDLWDGEL